MSDKASVRFQCSGANARQLAEITKLIAKHAILAEHLSPQVYAENSIRDRMIVTCHNPWKFIAELRSMGFFANIYHGPV